MPRRVLIAESTATNRIGLKASLSAARYDPIACGTGAEALTALGGARPDAVVLDQLLPDMSAAEFCRRAHDALGDTTPPILALMDDNDPDTRLDVLQAGADSLIERPVERAWLLTHLRSLLRAWETRAELRRRSITAARIGLAEDQSGFDGLAKIAVVGGDRTDAMMLARKLRTSLSHQIDIATPEEALTIPPRGPAEVYLLCLGARSDDSLTLLSELRARSDSKRAAILVQYAQDNDPHGARALDQGASDLFRIDARTDEIGLRIARQLKAKRRSDALRASVEAGLALAAHDPLTGLFNRRYAERYLDDLSERNRAKQQTYGLVALDIDHFKDVNDTHGHAAGDAVLAQVARRLTENLREGDLLARLGGEEFLVVLPVADDDHVNAAAERLRKAICAAPFECPNGTALQVSVSAGTVCGLDRPDTMRALADAALYRAKDNGRNRVAVAACPPFAADVRRRGDEAAEPYAHPR